MAINVLSLFDGMSCGQIALNRHGIKYNSYIASEIDKFAIKITQKNYPDTIHVGDVTKVFVTNSGIEVDLPNSQMRTIGWIPDLILAGSPCQGLSKAGKGLGLKDPRSKLFFEFVRILHEAQSVNPNVKFLLENVEMPKTDELTISKILGIHPIKINSTLLSAQNRVRLYWTNICTQYSGLFDNVICAIPQPRDKGIFLKDILQPESEVDEKYYLSDKAMSRIEFRHPSYKPQINPEKTGCLLSGNQNGKNTDNGTTYIRYADKSSCLDAPYYKGLDQHAARTGVITHNLQPRSGKGSGGKGHLKKEDGKSYALDVSAGRPVQRILDIGNGGQGNRVYNPEFKSVTLNSMGGGRCTKTGLYEIKSRIRRLTPLECERLQTVPDNFTQGVSDSQRYRMLGNGWTVDVICHIFSFL